jgi:hypothetical protein
MCACSFHLTIHKVDQTQTYTQTKNSTPKLDLSKTINLAQCVDRGSHMRMPRPGGFVCVLAYVQNGPGCGCNMHPAACARALVPSAFVLQLQREGRGRGEGDGVGFVFVFVLCYCYFASVNQGGHNQKPTLPDAPWYPFTPQHTQNE